MKSPLKRRGRKDEGVLTFEWILLLTVLVIGVVGGLSAVRDAVLSELGDLAQAITSLDQTYFIVNPLEVRVHDNVIDGGSDSQFIDSPEYVNIARPTAGFPQQGSPETAPSGGP